jgi:Domain of unknown function (DUF4173)
MSARATLWVAAFVVAGLGAWTLWSAAPGVNWGLWTVVTAAGGVACARFIGGRPGIRVGLCATACALAAGAAVTADPFFHVLIFLGVTWLFALAAYVADDPRGERIGLALGILAPFVIMPLGLVEAGRRAGELTMVLGTERHRPVLRGSILASAVVGVFGLILAGADPILAAFRDELVLVLERLEFIPRLVFFGVLFVGAVGSYGLAQRPGAPASVSSRPAASTSRTETERVIVLSAVALLFAAFLGLQLSYLFGNAPARVGSGVTFAEYARRGFAELTVVASLCTLLILWLERGPRRGVRERGLAFLLTVLLWILLVSAFRRLWLYEEAYGFTTARLYAQIYMIVVACGLVLLVIELARGLDARRFLRRITMVGLVTLVVLTFWNHEGWIARRNIERAARGGPLDAYYLVWNLSVNAVPAIVASLDRTPLGEVLAEAVIARYTRRMKLSPCRWFEWNLRQVEAANALYTARLVAGETPDSGIVPGCVRLVRQ